MRNGIIVANGQLVKPPNLQDYITSSSLIIAANGGIRNCISIGIQPNIIIGDLDSTEDSKLEVFRKAGVKIIQYPNHKDESDLELALQYAKDHKINDVILLGGLGARWDMTIANLLIIAHPMYIEMNIHILDGTQEVFILRAGKCSTIKGRLGDAISLIPISSDVTGIMTSGLEYPLNNETLQFGTTRGVSNVFTQHQAQIFITQGVLLCIINREKINQAIKGGDSP